MLRRFAAATLAVTAAAVLTGTSARAEYTGPPVLDSPAVTSIAAGNSHTCLVRGGNVWCAGLSTSGQTGTTATTQSQNFEPALMHDAVSVAAGGDTTCAIAAGGTLWCWGLVPGAYQTDTPGVLRWDRADAPTAVPLAGVTAVSVGPRHACAVASGGAVWCWGDNLSGQLGNGSTQATTIPVRVRVPAVVSIDAGGSHTCAVSRAGAVWCWGANRFHQSGRRGTKPLLVPALTPVRAAASVVTGGDFSCALGTDARIRCWGRNNSFQLGTATGKWRIAPVTVPGRNYVSVSAGGEHACAVRSTGTTWCWGSNSSGELANGGWTRKWNPQKVLTNATVGAVVSVTAGLHHVCATTTVTGALWCWGSGANGQLGDSSTVTRRSGTAVWPNGVRMQSIGSDTSARVVMTADVSCNAARRIASGEGPDGPMCGDAWVADLTESLKPDAVVAIGDLQYEDANAADLRDFWDVSWSALSRSLYPVRGNHEYVTPGAAGYVGYFGPQSAGYWWADMGGWRLIAVDSWCLGQLYAGCAAGSAQGTWLAAQLDAARSLGKCAAVVWHHPPFSSGRFATASALPFWTTAVEHGADLVVTGHDHLYERFARLDAQGQPSPTGTQLIISGMGGAQATPVGTTAATGSEYRQNTDHGVTEFTFAPRSFSWRFVSAVNSAVMDSGSAECS